ncbi:MAG: extracellular solute-binding protein [Candidatus Moranbacteria bacterium]|jgi:ABC-type glycerol-3-phosphate transport system substrate-binding protein|nr:extracellular solute-binding protein [Candidatus Moranbacteria bacterium]
MPYTRRAIFGTLLFLGSLGILSGCGLRDNSQGTPYSMPLEVWSVFDDSSVYNVLFQQYRGVNPFVGNISYRKFGEETYKKELLNALAAGNGPDIFVIRNSWVNEFRDKIVPAPEYQLSEKEIHDNFVDVVAYDFVDPLDKKIYGLPLSVDSLALYYNRDIFNAAGITAPPKTWQEILTLVPRLTQIDQFGNIVQSALAFGTADNVNRAPAILLGLMFGIGAEISDQYGRINFFQTEAAQKAFEYYMLFSNVRSSEYTWNPNMHYSIDAFYEGRLAMMVNYSWRYETLRQKNAKLNMAVAPFPQFEGIAPQNYADYWTFVVAKNREIPSDDLNTQKLLPADKGTQNELRKHEAWQLLAYMAMPHPQGQITLRNGLTGNPAVFTLDFDPAEKYLEQTRKPAARRDLIEKQRSDPVLSPFAIANLTAKNFPQADADAVEKILNEMIRSVNRGEVALKEALSIAQQRINTLQ